MAPSILDAPPSEVKADLDKLSSALDQEIPAKKPGQNILVATWNIRAFSSLTRKWTALGNDSPKRDLRGPLAITEIVSRFDVVAVQEVKGDLRALRDMMEKLGPDWGFLMTDVTRGDAGNQERLAFVFDRQRVTPSGLAAELVVPPKWLKEIKIDALDRQFVRTPYAVSFRAGDQTFILVTLHVDYGDQADERIPELKAIARWMADWAKQTNRHHQDLITLGDFNVDRKDDKLWKAFTSTGLTAPAAHNDVKRTVFWRPNEPETHKFYDQIAWFTTKSKKKERLTMKVLNAGGFDFLPHVYRNKNLSTRSLSFRVSDHYPLWVEFAA